MSMRPTTSLPKANHEMADRVFFGVGDLPLGAVVQRVPGGGLIKKENRGPIRRTTVSVQSPSCYRSSESADDNPADKQKCSNKDDQIDWSRQVHLSRLLSQVGREVYPN